MLTSLPIEVGTDIDGILSQLVRAPPTEAAIQDTTMEDFTKVDKWGNTLIKTPLIQTIIRR